MIRELHNTGYTGLVCILRSCPFKWFLDIVDDEDSGDDDTDVPNRNAIKKQSQFIVDSKTKRRTTKKKKKTK